MAAAELEAGAAEAASYRCRLKCIDPERCTGNADGHGGCFQKALLSGSGSVCMCVCIYIYICMYLCVCVCVFSHTQTYAHTHTETYVCSSALTL